MTVNIQTSPSFVSTVTITEPHSLGTPLLQSLLTILTEETDSSTRVLILTASHPEALLADVAALKRMTPAEAFAFSELGQKVCAAIEALPYPVVPRQNSDLPQNQVYKLFINFCLLACKTGLMLRLLGLLVFLSARLFSSRRDLLLEKLA